MVLWSCSIVGQNAGRSTLGEPRVMRCLNESGEESARSKNTLNPGRFVGGI